MNNPGNCVKLQPVFMQVKAMMMRSGLLPEYDSHSNRYIA